MAIQSRTLLIFRKVSSFAPEVAHIHEKIISLPITVKLVTDKSTRTAELLMTVYQQCLLVKERDEDDIIQKMSFLNE